MAVATSVVVLVITLGFRVLQNEAAVAGAIEAAMVVTRAAECQPVRMLASDPPQPVHGTLLKKSIVALLVALALVILVSPGIIGRLAERSLEHDLDSPREGNGEVIVTPQGFERGWFSSEGRHRVELRDGRLARLLLASIEEDEASKLPVLIVDTHIDHGLIPLGSMSREHGSLKPGLGRAVSTLQLEWPDGKSLELPGAVYSTINLGGELQSNYNLPAGGTGDEGHATAWGDVDVKLALEPRGESALFDAVIDSASFTRAGDTVTIGRLAVSGATSRSTDGRVAGHSSLDLERVPLAGLGAGDIHAAIRFAGIDAAALDELARSLERAAATGQPPGADDALRRFVAAGFEFDVEHFDVATPDGPFGSALRLHLKPMNAASFAWPSVLLALDAGAEFRIPAQLFERAGAQDPDLNALAGLGYLRRQDDFYELHATFETGVLTVNGAPVAIPLTGIF